ncbi:MULTISPECIES: amino acid ABC transporter permease [Brevibacterium]|uniref:Polar amino acid ABC transporter inner membrane protein n=4 Tax=Bacteria TaxID=2 RepID=K9B452_9MICO|nr:amino acid ABC transporter permease [Brevibacterium casei]NJE68543.1 amino acid ABC transporter permease [Brevibacterium sp. LS14]EKU49607.1 polar amino acid ABC transporter inner membrane protein [Brevibacterium casei S18]KZE13740.1 amino acid ABC transporter permease [Brevibacterium casei]MBE4693696.1 amino acid ABC transporter permease [Brevibacterium casei]MBY3576819.1 amino acid ABC transporter permease [Brevibacterium casei]
MDFVQLLELFGSGVWGTVKLFTVALVGSLVLGTILAAMRVSPTPVLRIAASTYINVVRNTPLTLVMFFCAFGLPFLDIRFGSSSSFNSFVYATIALTAYTACFVAETLKAGIATIPVGQAEAARAIGLTFNQTLSEVILPQAFRTVIPPLGSVVIAMLKNTSIASAFNNRELISAMRNAIELRGDLVIPILFGTAVAYLVLALILGRIFSYLERKLVILR